ncbi:MAG: hypothetical protein LBG60_13135 [Bifidobacteriaceae bacterium]|nr:hypothetical protein [Bifidobacteriaceae bacterium]
MFWRASNRSSASSSNSEAGAQTSRHGTDSTGLVSLSGHVLGGTKGSRLTHEFDVAGLLRERGNRLEVRVARFNAGSYLEAQDMWRLSGVLRDATPLAVPPGDCL